MSPAVKSEEQLQRKLHLSRRSGKRRNASGRRIVGAAAVRRLDEDIGIGLPEVGPVRQVEDFRAELNGRRAPKRHVLDETQVDCHEVGSGQAVSANSTE